MEKTQEHLSFGRPQAANEQPNLKRPLTTLRNNGQPGVREFFRILRRRKTSVFSVFVLFMAINALLLTQLSPQYKAESFVLIEHQPGTVDRAVNVETPEDKEWIKNEIEVIRSRPMAQEVIDRVKLNNLSEFNPTLRPETFHKLIANYLSVLRDEPWIVDLLGRGAHPKPAGNAAEAEKVKIVDNFLEKLEVSTTTASQVIAVRFASEDPVLAAKAVNTVVDVYLSHLVDMRVAAAGKTTHLLEEEVRPLRQAVADSERAVEEFRSQSGLLRGGQLTLISEEMSEMNRRFAAANAERAEAEANLHEINSLRKIGDIDSALRVLDSPLIQQLRVQEAAILREMAELSKEYGSQHPKLINKRAELRDLREKISAELAKIVKGYENAMAAASGRAVNLQNEVNKLKTQLTEANSREVQLRELEREAEANRRVLDTFLSRLKETIPQFNIDAQQPNAHVLSSAEIPEYAMFPPKNAIFLLATLLSLAFGVGLALLLEHLDRSYRSGEQIEQATRLPVLAMLPMLPFRTARQGSPESQVLQNHPSLFAEGIRMTYARLALRSGRSPFRTILVTSSMPQEGKTSLALCLARLRALAGHKTVVVDADLRQPSINRRLRSPREPGLVELLLGEAELEQVLYRDEQSGAFAIPAGKATFDPTDLLGSVRVKALLELLHKSFELVIFDSPPVMTVADACNLAALVDKTLLVVRWGKTARDVVDFALNKISEAKGPPAGVVLYMVDPKKIVLYGYGDAAYYDRAVQKYYVGPPEPLVAATAVEHASAEAPGEHTGLSDAPIVGLPLIAPGRGLTVDALVQGKPKAVPSSPSLRTTIAGAAVVVLALVGTAVAWTLLRSGMDAPVEAGPVADASGPSPPTMAVARAPEHSEPVLAPAAAPTSPSAAATTKAETAGPTLAEPTQKPTEAVVIPLPTEPTAPDRLAEKAMGDEQPTPATSSPLATHAEIALLLARGDELLAVSDVVSARLFFAGAARQGNAPAMTAIASTYDPLMLASRNVRGVHPEPREAISWYRRAAAAGDATAEGRLRALVDVLRQSGQIEASESAALLRVGERP